MPAARGARSHKSAQDGVPDISQRHYAHSSTLMRTCTQALYGDEASLVALFTFVARDPVTQRALAINPLLPGSAADTALFAQRQHIADERRAARQAAVQSAGIRGRVTQIQFQRALWG